MDSLFGIKIREDINEFSKCRSEHWMKAEYDEIVVEYWNSPKGN